MKYSQEQFEDMLKGNVEGEEVRPIFRAELIHTIESSLQKKKRWWLTPLFPTTAVAILLLVVLARWSTDTPTQIIDTPEMMESTSATPWRVPSDWEQEHVSYVAADGFELPRLIPSYELIPLDIVRENTDAIAAKLNPRLLEKSITEDDKSILYSADGETLVFYKDENESQRMSYQLFPNPSPDEYDTERRERIRAVNRKEKIERDLTDVERILNVLPSVEGAQKQYVYGPSQDTYYDVAQRMILDHGFAFEGHGVDFFDGRLFYVISPLVIDARETTVDYGSLEEILSYMNWNAYFPPSLWMKQASDVQVQYEIVDYSFSEDGLFLKARMLNFPEVRDAFDGMDDIRSQRETWIYVPVPEEREQLRREIEVYKENHPEE